jgi:hypothetical protein
MVEYEKRNVWLSTKGFAFGIVKSSDTIPNSQALINTILEINRNFGRFRS